MDLDNKKLIFINKSQPKPDEYDSFEYNKSGKLLRVNLRDKGINEAFLKASLHWHDFYELEFVYDGKGRHIFGKTDCKMKRGFVCFRTPATLHSTIQDSQNKLKLYNIQFTEDYISDIVDTHLIVPDKTFWTMYSDSELKAAIEHIKIICNETEKSDKYSFAAIKAELTNLFINFMRKQTAIPKADNEGSESVQQVIQYIHNNFRDSISLTDLAKTVYLTPNYLGELFKKRTGKTCSEYINDLRFSLAAQLLINTKHSVNEISFECGFNSTAYFIKKFKEKYGCSPLKFRQEHLSI